MTQATGGIDWDDAFDNSGYIDGAADYPARWAEAAENYRELLRTANRLREGLAYGDAPRERLDLFLPERNSAGLVVFVHGGYWIKFDKSYWSHLAAGCVDRGWSVVLPSYPVAPGARISEITRAIARAVEYAAGEVTGPIRLTGHSAGGHLVSRMMCAGVLAESTAERVHSVVSISGLHQLSPLTGTALNNTLNLTEEEALAESPALCAPLAGVAHLAWVGARERPEFIRQTRLIEEVWAAKGASVSAVYDPGHDHFTVVDALTEHDSALTEAVLKP